MTTQEIEKVKTLQRQGFGYKKIAAETGISVNTVKSYCRTHPVEELSTEVCEQCGLPIHQEPHRKKKRFCSDKCRNAWWSAHPEMRKAEKPYSHKCLHCGADFTSDRPNSRYCSLACSGKAKRWEVSQ